jgi:hypothetical protein
MERHQLTNHELDADAGLTIDYICDEDWLSLHLDRVPRRAVSLGRAIGKGFGYGERSRRDITTRLKSRAWVVGPPASGWERLWHFIRDPIASSPSPTSCGRASATRRSSSGSWKRSRSRRAPSRGGGIRR